MVCKIISFRFIPVHRCCWKNMTRLQARKGMAPRRTIHPSPSFIGTTTTKPMIVRLFILGAMMACHPSSMKCGVNAFAPSTASSQHATTIPQPPPALRPCHDINSDDPLFVLGLTTKPNPSKAEIKRAYKALVLFYHPDAIADLKTTPEKKQEVNSRFAKINAAYREALRRLAQMEQEQEDEAQRLAYLNALSKSDPFNWAVRTVSMNREHATAQSRFEYTPVWNLGIGTNTSSQDQSRQPSKKVHIRRRTEPLPDKTVDPFNWATSVKTGW